MPFLFYKQENIFRSDRAKFVWRWLEVLSAGRKYWTFLFFCRGIGWRVSQSQCVVLHEIKTMWSLYDQVMGNVWFSDRFIILMKYDLISQRLALFAVTLRYSTEASDSCLLWVQVQIQVCLQLRHRQLLSAGWRSRTVSLLSFCHVFKLTKDISVNQGASGTQCCSSGLTACVIVSVEANRICALVRGSWPRQTGSLLVRWQAQCVLSAVDEPFVAPFVSPCSPSVCTDATLCRKGELHKHFVAISAEAGTYRSYLRLVSVQVPAFTQKRPF